MHLMGSDGNGSVFRRAGGVVRRRRRIIIASVLLATAVGVGIAALQTPVYSASTDVLVQPRWQDTRSASQATNAKARAIPAEINVIEGRAVRERVQADLGLGEPPPPANASGVGDSDVISITVRNNEAGDTAALADAYAVAYINVRREQDLGELRAAGAEIQLAIDGLQAQIADLDRGDPRRAGLTTQVADLNTTLGQLRVDAALRTGGTIVQPADAPEKVEPRPLRTALIAALIGLLVGLVLAFLVDHLDDKIRSEGDLAPIVDKPVLGVIPIDPRPDNQPIVISRPNDDAVDAYRALRTNVEFLAIDQPVKVIQLTSSTAGEGKTTTAANLAVVLAQAGHRVALLDADLRRPGLHAVFGIPQEPGFTDLLLGAEARETVNYVAVEGGNRLSVYTAGIVPSNPSELLGGSRTRRLLEAMGNHYDYVIVDSASIVPVSDSVALAGAVHGVIVVVQAGRVTHADLTDAIGRLERVAAPLVGFVLNRATKAAMGDSVPIGHQPGRRRDDDNTFQTPRPSAEELAEVEAALEADDAAATPWPQPTLPVVPGTPGDSTLKG